ncbi:TPA: hypothetical protein P7N21_001433 [Citrobacter freundii]|nr:hypothetical protein [Citrobacter freundii]
MSNQCGQPPSSVVRFFYVRNCPVLWWGVTGERSRSPVSLIAGLLTLLRLTTPFSSGLVRFAKPNQ